MTFKYLINSIQILKSRYTHNTVIDRQYNNTNICYTNKQIQKSIPYFARNLKPHTIKPGIN